MIISCRHPIIHPTNHSIILSWVIQCKLADDLDACRWFYNRPLQDLNEAREKGIKLKTRDTQNMIPSLKLANPRLNLVHSKVLQIVNCHIKDVIIRIGWLGDDLLQRPSCTYINDFDLICAGDLEIKGLEEKGPNSDMNHCIHDASWSELIFMLSHKAQCAGWKLMKVDLKDATKWCSAWGSIGKKDPSIRSHECPYRGSSRDRESNASMNTLITGMEQPVVPIEPKLLHRISVMQALAMKWEAAPFRTQ